jgi:hypothetical protein
LYSIIHTIDNISKNNEPFYNAISLVPSILNITFFKGIKVSLCCLGAVLGGCLFEAGSHCVAPTSLELMILLVCLLSAGIITSTIMPCSERLSMFLCPTPIYSFFVCSDICSIKYHCFFKFMTNNLKAMSSILSTTGKKKFRCYVSFLILTPLKAFQN